MNNGKSFSSKPLPLSDESIYIEIQNNGPYLVHGNIPIQEYFVVANRENVPIDYRVGEVNYIKPNAVTALCRCGKSKHRPYCDGTHVKIAYQNIPLKITERLLDGAEVIDGDDLSLTDNDHYCSFARFCEAKGRIWHLVKERLTEENLEDALNIVSKCPSGRLQLWDKRLKEEWDLSYPQEMGLIEDTILGLSGPIWLRGGISLRTAEGFDYERRNRVTICRCGRSTKAPFCNGSHSLK